jgi:hypothetical protein
MSYKQTGTNTWTIEVQENSKTKELFLEFPPDVIDQVGWDTGDTLLWEELPNGSWSITKKQDETYPVDSKDTLGTRMDDSYYYFKKEK